MINEANSVALESMPMLTPTEVLEHIWCPRFTWFMNVQHIPQHEEHRYKVLKGRVIHTRKATENKAYLRRKMGVVDKQIDVYLASPQLRLRGIVDEILWLKDGSLAPLDYKYTTANEHNIVFKTHQTQIQIYALLAQAVYKQEVTKGFVAYIRGQNKFYEVPVHQELREEINLILDDIFDIIQTGRLPRRSRQTNHCIDCCYRNICV
jgi:CRISPR-associated exonuclease Cas4